MKTKIISEDEAIIGVITAVVNRARKDHIITSVQKEKILEKGGNEKQIKNLEKEILEIEKDVLDPNKFISFIDDVSKKTIDKKKIIESWKETIQDVLDGKITLARIKKEGEEDED